MKKFKVNGIEVTLDAGAIIHEGNKIGTVNHDFKFGYHPALNCTIFGEGAHPEGIRWFELDEENLLDKVVEHIVKVILDVKGWKDL